MDHKVIIIRTHDDRAGTEIPACYRDWRHHISACPDDLELNNSLQRDLSPAVRLTQLTLNKRPSTKTRPSSRVESKGEGEGEGNPQE